MIKRSFVTLTLILSLVLICLNILFLKSLLLGIVVTPPFIIISSYFCGNVFFIEHSQRFKIIYGFVIYYCILVILGFAAYWIYDLSNLAIVAILFFFTFFLLCFNLRGQPLRFEKTKMKQVITRIRIGVLDFLFVILVGLCFYLLFAARTGESIPPPWNLVSVWFFVCLVLSTTVLLAKMWSGKSPSSLMLLYAILLILIAAFGLLIITHNPYDMKNARDLESTWEINGLGRFVVNAVHPEAANSIMHKSIMEKGENIGDTFLIKFIQGSPLDFALYFVPILFTFIVVFVSFDLMQAIAPKMKTLALLCGVSFLVTQHDVFLFTPPGKNETLALGFLMISILLWVKFFNSEKSRRSLFTGQIFLVVAICIIHQYVGIFALFIAASALSLHIFKRVRMRLRRILFFTLVNLGFISVWVYSYPFVMSFAAYLTGSTSSGIDLHQLSLSKFIQTVAPAFWSRTTGGFWQDLFSTFVNNSVYITYIFILIGVIAAFSLKLNKDWLAITFSSIALAFLYFSVVGNFHIFSETYRFFYYFSFLAFPLMAVGLYWLSSNFIESKAWIHVMSQIKKPFISLKPVQLAICCVLLASLFVSSVWAGYPRPDSMGPYHYPNNVLWYPSDYDFSALNFIKAREGDAPYKDFFIVGDHPTSAAGMLTLKYQVVSTNQGYISIFTFFVGRFGFDQFFNLAAYQPIKYLIEGTNYTNALTTHTYLVFTYRLGSQLQPVVNTYSEYLGNPIFSIDNKVYVFCYNKTQISSLLTNSNQKSLTLFDDEQAKDGFWKIENSGLGNLSISIDNSYEVKESGNSSLKIMTAEGQYDYVGLRYPLAEQENFSKYEYLILWAYGSNSGRAFYVTFRSGNPENYFTFQEVDNFEGWKPLIIPLSAFAKGDNASWLDVTEMVIQFFGSSWSSGPTLYLDQTSLVQQPSLELLYYNNYLNLT